MTEPLDLEEGWRVLQAATPGEWTLEEDGPWNPESVSLKVCGNGADVARLMWHGNAKFIVWMKRNASTLLDAAAERDRLRDLLAKYIAWVREQEGVDFINLGAHMPLEEYFSDGEWRALEKAAAAPEDTSG